MSTTETKTPKGATNPKTGVFHTEVKEAVGSAPRSKKGQPTVPRSARFFFETAKANPEVLIPVYDEQNIRPAKGAEKMSLPVFSSIFRADLNPAAVEKLFGGSENVARMAIDYANEVILTSDAVRVRTSEMSENAAFLEAKRFADVLKGRTETKGKDSITEEWTNKTKEKIALLVAKELEVRRAKKELEEDEDDSGYDEDDKTEEDEDDEETPAKSQSAPRIVTPKKNGKR